MVPRSPVTNIRRHKQRLSFWLRGKFLDAKTLDDCQKIKSKLASLPSVDVREFLFVDSDVDLIVKKNKLNLDVTSFGIQKIDEVLAIDLDPASERGRSETLQGFIPVEKIRLSQNGFIHDPRFGNGIAEIYHGKYSVHFSSAVEFRSTYFAKLKWNHPLLLALRFIRLLAIEDFKTNDDRIDHLSERAQAADPDVLEKLKQVIDYSKHDPTLLECTVQPKFIKFLEKTIEKSFRVTVNPNYTREIYNRYGLFEFLKSLPHAPSMNQYLFARSHVKNEKSDWTEQFATPVDKAFPDQTLYHVTKTQKFFQAILLQGVLPSTSGNMGGGLYGVNSKTRENVPAFHGTPYLMIGFPIKKWAKIVDVTQGEGLIKFSEFSRHHERKQNKKHIADLFAEDYQIDILIYDYVITKAFVVKNSAVLEKPFGVYNQVETFNSAVSKINSLYQSEDILGLTRLILSQAWLEGEIKYLSQLLYFDQPFLPLWSLNAAQRSEIYKLQVVFYLLNHFGEKYSYESLAPTVEYVLASEVFLSLFDFIHPNPIFSEALYLLVSQFTSDGRSEKSRKFWIEMGHQLHQKALNGLKAYRDYKAKTDNKYMQLWKEVELYRMVAVSTISAFLIASSGGATIGLGGVLGYAMAHATTHSSITAQTIGCVLGGAAGVCAAVKYSVPKIVDALALKENFEEFAAPFKKFKERIKTEKQAQAILNDIIKTIDFCAVSLSKSLNQQ